MAYGLDAPIRWGLDDGGIVHDKEDNGMDGNDTGLGPMTLDEAIEQLRRVAKRHEGMKGLLHEIADTIEAGVEELREQKMPVMLDEGLGPIVDYCINLGQSYAHDQIELAEARSYISGAILDYANAVSKADRASSSQETGE
jgi:hypothetical protein